MSNLGHNPNDDRPPRRKWSHVIALIIIGICLCIAFRAAVGNGRYGGETPGAINDRLQTVRQIEDRADATWALNTARTWTEEDFAACDEPGGRVLESMQKCMHERTTARILYMLRRGCTGVSTIASACKMEVK